jgi:L-alanine-DL-glutamate epimerase-like enolase superfamily enzyme
VPVDGYVTLPSGPGMGIELDDSKIQDRRDVTF